MWKDYLYLNKKEKSAFWAFTVLIVLMQFAIWTSGKWLPLIVRPMMSDEIAEKDSIENLKILTGTDKQESYEKRSGSRYVKTIRLYKFDPNTVDSATLVSFGIRPYVAKNIVKYRRKGGKFRKPDDLSRIYGLEKSSFESLSPYIIIGNDLKTEGKYDSTSRYESKESIINQTNAIAIPNDASNIDVKNFRFELNSADTSSLQLLKGVGPVTATMIIRYGNQLGGYHDISQLAEIKGIYPNALASLQRSLTVNPLLIKKININKASLEKLKSHPYLDFYQAKVIVGLRNARKGIKDLKELAEFKEFSSEDLDKLKWYLEI